jgi:hypothetical protein
VPQRRVHTEGVRRVRTREQARRDRLSLTVDGLTLLMLMVVTGAVVAVTMLLSAGGEG